MKTNLLICILKCINCIKIYNTYKIGGLKVVDFPIFYMRKGESLLKIIHIIVVISILISIMNIILNSLLMLMY